MKAFRTLAALSLVCTAVAVADDAPPASQPSPVDYQKMKSAMPDTLIGLKRTDLRGNQRKFGHTATSDTKADYGGEDGKPAVHIEAMSFGNPDMIKQMSGAWTMAGIDNEDDDGFQKTVKMQDHSGLVEYKTKDKHGSITLVVADRILLTVSFENMPADQLKQLENELPLKALDEAAK